MRSPNRRHDRTSFFKYLSAGGAVSILKNSSLRWSSPLTFNDPFDVPRELTVGIEADEIRKATGIIFRELMQNPPADTSFLAPKVKEIVELVKAGITDDVRREILAGLDTPVPFSQGITEALRGLRGQWKEWINDFRILCLTEGPDHVAMWHHYADEYKGVVLEFRCLDETDSPLLAAEKVNYSPDTSPLFTAEGWADILIRDMRNAIDLLFNLATTTKAADWAYENEWRVVTWKRKEDPPGPYSFYPFHRRELAKIYFGPLIPEDKRIRLKKLALRYSEVDLVDVTFGHFGRLEFTDRAAKG